MVRTVGRHELETLHLNLNMGQVLRAPIGDGTCWENERLSNPQSLVMGVGEDGNLVVLEAAFP